MNITDKIKDKMIKDYIYNCKKKYLQAINEWHQAVHKDNDEFQTFNILKAFGGKQGMPLDAQKE
jgi:hypothetical protein